MPKTIAPNAWLEAELDYIERHDVVTDDREPWADEPDEYGTDLSDFDIDDNDFCDDDFED